VNNPGVYWYYSRTFNGYNTATPYGPASWTTTASDYMFDPGNSQFNFNGNMAIFSSIAIQTDQLPVSGELVFQLKQPVLRYVFNNGLYSSPPLYSGLPVDSQITYLYSANVDYVSDGALNPESVIYRASNGNPKIESNLVLSLGTTAVADGPLQTGNLAVYTGSIWAGSDQWRKGNSGAYKKILQLLVTEALALHAKPIRRYNGSFYSSHDISRRYTFDLFDWLFIGGSLNANNENVDGEFFAIARDVSEVVDLDNDFIQGDLIPASANKYNGPNSFGGIFNNGSIGGMLVLEETNSVGPFSQPNAGEARITGTTTVDGDANFTQDVEVTGDLVVDGTIVIDGLGDVATESWVTSQGYLTTAVTSVALTAPSAFTVTGSPITTTGTIAIGAAGTSGQYVRGDGQLANFPTNTGGGSTVNYYLNGSVSQGTFGGVPYYEISRVPIVGAGTDFIRTNAAGNGYIASFITDAGDPALLNIPGGNWNLEFYFNSSSSGGTPSFYGELYKVNAANTFTLIASGSTNPEDITNGTTVDQYFTSIPVPQTTLLVTDRLAVRVYVITNGRTVTLHTENGNLSEVITTFSTGLNALNGLTEQVQYFATGTSGSDFNINSATNTHTFNFPTGSATNRGLISTADWTNFNTAYNDKINSAAVTGTTTKTLTLTQQDGGTITASWTDYDTAPVTSVFGRTGVVVAVGGDYNTSQVTENTNLYFTDARARAAISLTTTGTSGAATYNNTTGVINIPQYQSVLTNPVTGTGTTNYITKWTGTNTVNSSQIFDNGTNVGIGTTSPGAKLEVVANGESGRFNSSDANGSFISFRNNGTARGYIGSGFHLWGSPNNIANNLAIRAESQLDFGIGSSVTMTINSSANVGIGTTSPGTKLDVSGIARATSLSTVSGLGLQVGGYAFLSQTTSGVMTFLGHNIRASDSVANTAIVQNAGWISSLIKLYYNEGITFHTDTTVYAAGATYPLSTTERMRIQTNGNVGIGTTSPFSRFTVSGALSASTSQISIVNTEGGHSIIRAGISGVSNNGMSFVTANVDGSSQNVRMVVGATGNVGIGTTSPSASLQISSTGGVVFGATSGAVGTSQITTTSAGSPVSSRFAFGTDGSGWQYRIAKNTAGTVVDLITVSDSGNVGIGTTSPATRLDVLGALSADVTLQLKANASNDYNSKIFFSDNVSNRGVILYSNWQNYFSFFTNSSERVRIDSSGNVGIGTTSPTAKLDVSAGTNLNLGVQQLVLDNFTNDGVGITFSRTSSDADLMALGVADTDKLGLFSRSGIIFATGGAALYSAVSESMRITTAGDVGIGTTSPSAKLHVIGNATVSSTLATVNAKITGTLTDRLNLPGTAGQVLSSTATGIEWVAAGGGGGGSTIIVKDEGVSIGSSFTTLNFAGNNIQATASGATANITAFNNAGTGSNFLNAVTTNYTIPATFGDVEIDSAIIFAASPDAASGSSKLIATVTFGVENVSSYEGFNNFEFRLYDVSQSIVVSDTTHIWTGYMSKDEGATKTVFTFHIPLETDVTPGDEIRVQAQQGVSYTPEIYFCAITLLEGTT
jgi:hypothetical protein